MPTNPKEPREWGPDDNGRWGNLMMSCRDVAAEQLLIILRRANDLDTLARQGEDTRTHRILISSQIREAALVALMNLQKAGAPVDPTNLSLQQGTDRDQYRGRE